MRSRLRNILLALLGIIAFVVIAFTLEDEAGIPFAVTFRVACAGMCLFLMFQMSSEFPGERWPRIALVLAALFNFALFFSPLAQLPASKGDILFFGAPDAVIFLTARTITYPVTDVHQRAVRQQLILGLIIACAISAILMSIMFFPHPDGHRSTADKAHIGLVIAAQAVTRV